MKPNTHPETGIAFGVIAASKLDDEIVEQLMYGRHAVNISFETAKTEHLAEARLDHVENSNAPFDEVRIVNEFTEDYENDQPTIEGTKDGVKYHLSWIGGAPHFYIFESPIIGFYRPCCPCCPGAGDLHTTNGNLKTYNVPPDWRL